MAADRFCPSPIRQAASAGPPPARDWKPLVCVIFGKCRVYRKRACVGVRCQRRLPIGHEQRRSHCAADDSMKVQKAAERETLSLRPSFLFMSYLTQKDEELHPTMRWPKVSHCSCFVFFCFLGFPCPRSHLHNAGINVILLAGTFSHHNEKQKIGQQEMRRRSCCGRAWRISALQLHPTSLGTCLVKTARPFPDLASTSCWYNRTFMRRRGTRGFTSRLQFPLVCSSTPQLDSLLFFFCREPSLPSSSSFSKLIIRLVPFLLFWCRKYECLYWAPNICKCWSFSMVRSTWTLAFHDKILLHQTAGFGISKYWYPLHPLTCFLSQVIFCVNLSRHAYHQPTRCSMSPDVLA